MSYAIVTTKINVDGICKYAMHSNGNDINILIGNLFKLNHVLRVKNNLIKFLKAGNPQLFSRQWWRI